MAKALLKMFILMRIKELTSRKKKLMKILSSKKESETYSACLREMNKENSKDRERFMKAFKEAFDDAMEEELEDHQNIALLKAKQEIG